MPANDRAGVENEPEAPLAIGYAGRHALAGLSFAALLLSVALLQLSSGAVGPLDALSGLQFGFSNAEVGLLGSAHFLGFFLSCWWAPRLMGSVGHSRAFAAFAALGAIRVLAHMLIVNPLAWAPGRFFWRRSFSG